MPDLPTFPSASQPPDKSKSVAAEIKFFEGPQSRGFELFRAVKVFFEFLRGYRALHFIGPCVTVFGSARFPESHPYYAMGREVGAKLAQAGFAVMTGGGPGIMEAANRGAKDVGGVSVACNIRLPKEQRPNDYLDHFVTFEHFFVRKVMLVKYSYAFVALPGGFGTMDEVFEAATLIQTGKIMDFPLVMMGISFWQPLLEFLRGTMLPMRTIDGADIDRIFLTDSADAAVRHIEEVALGKFKLQYGTRSRPRWILFEREWQKKNSTYRGA